MHDLTAVENPRFEYKVRPAVPGAEPATISLDLDRVMLDLQLAIPTAFRPIEDSGNGDGPLKSGLQKICECLQSGEAIPRNLPSFDHVLAAARKALMVPEHCGVRLVMAVFMAFVAEIGNQAEQKKNTPDSPASSEPIQASSA